MKHIKRLEKLEASSDILDFAKNFNTIEETIDNCPYGKLMIWISHKLGVSDRKITLAKGIASELVAPFMRHERSENAVKIAVKYGKGEATEEELCEANSPLDPPFSGAEVAYFASHNDYESSMECMPAITTSLADRAARRAGRKAARKKKTETEKAITYSGVYHTVYDAELKEREKKTADICRKYLREDILRKF
jgi:hypothetical protein